VVEDSKWMTVEDVASNRRWAAMEAVLMPAERQRNLTHCNAARLANRLDMERMERALGRDFARRSRAEESACLCCRRDAVPFFFAKVGQSFNGAWSF